MRGRHEPRRDGGVSDGRAANGRDGPARHGPVGGRRLLALAAAPATGGPPDAAGVEVDVEQATAALEAIYLDAAGARRRALEGAGRLRAWTWGRAVAVIAWTLEAWCSGAQIRPVERLPGGVLAEGRAARRPPPGRRGRTCAVSSRWFMFPVM